MMQWRFSVELFDEFSIKYSNVSYYLSASDFLPESVYSMNFCISRLSRKFWQKAAKHSAKCKRAQQRIGKIKENERNVDKIVEIRFDTTASRLARVNATFADFGVVA